MQRKSRTKPSYPCIPQPSITALNHQTPREATRELAVMDWSASPLWAMAALHSSGLSCLSTSLKFRCHPHWYKGQSSAQNPTKHHPHQFLVVARSKKSHYSECWISEAINSHQETEEDSIKCGISLYTNHHFIYLNDIPLIPQSFKFWARIKRRR